MTITTSQLTPYKSFLFASLPQRRPVNGIVRRVVSDVQTLICPDDGESRTVAHYEPPVSSNGLQFAFLHYVEEKEPSWLSDTDIRDETNHLVFVARHKRLMAILVTDSVWRDRIRRSFGDLETEGLVDLSPIPQDTMNAAFINSRSKTMWLSGAHRRIESKPDSKVLSGMNLRYALDPLADQSYYFTAAKGDVSEIGIKQSVGVTPRGSRAWVGPATDWNDFRKDLQALLKRLEDPGPDVHDPFPVLASPTLVPDKVSNAYEVALIPPSLLAGDEQDPVLREKLERLAGIEFEVTGRNGTDFDANLMADGEHVGEVRIRFNFDDPGRLTYDVEHDSNGDSGGVCAEAVTALTTHQKWLRVWYESGHTLNDGAVYEMKYRDMPFGGYEWAKLTGINVKQEKPTDPTNPRAAWLDQIGNQSSLFCWVQRHWPDLDADRASRGWLTCDDGSMEIADFIHVSDPGRGRALPLVSLIHVKGAKSDNPNRSISVSDYEVVVGQAVKNLRHLDEIGLATALNVAPTNQVWKLVWKNGKQQPSRESLIRRLKQMGANYEREVVVVQPRVTRTALERARQSRVGSTERTRLQQLDTLLLGAEANCRALGARFRVIGAT